MTNYFTALCVDNTGKWMKYRNVKQDNTSTFEKFCKLKNVRYINYYDKHTKIYIKRVYL